MLNSKVRVTALVISILLVGCGGGSSSSNNTTTPAILQVVPGSWSGTYVLGSGSKIAVSGAVSTGGFGYFADNQGNVFMFEEIPDSSPFTSSLIGTAAPGQTFSNGTSADTFSVSGTFSSSATVTTMQATFASIDTSTDTPTGLNGSFTLNSDVPYTGNVTLTGLQGQWSGYYVGKASTSVVFTINADGVFSGNDGNGCSINGSLIQQSPGANLFYVNYTTAGAGCPGAMDGLAFESSKDTSGAFGGVAGTYLYLGIFGRSVAETVELRL